MKKNLLSILILALLIVNIVFSGIIMFSVVGAANKTSALITDIAKVLNLEIGATLAAGEVEIDPVAIEDTEYYKLTEEMTINLKTGEDGTKNFVMIKSASFVMDKSHEDYKKYVELMVANESAMKSAIIDVYGSYTLDEVEANKEGIETEILEKVQSIFDSEFIFNVLLEPLFQ